MQIKKQEKDSKNTNFIALLKGKRQGINSRERKLKLFFILEP
jgi:hypothetical protein